MHTRLGAPDLKRHKIWLYTNLAKKNFVLTFPALYCFSGKFWKKIFFQSATDIGTPYSAKFQSNCKLLCCKNVAYRTAVSAYSRRVLFYLWYHIKLLARILLDEPVSQNIPK